MITIPDDLSTLSKQQLQELAGSATQDVMNADGVPYVTAWGLAKARYKPVFDELQKRADADRADIQAPPPILGNDEKARIALTTPSQENCLALGLNPSKADFDDYSECAKGAKDIANPDFEGAFNALSSFTARKRGLSSDAADQQVAVAHPNLFKKANMQNAARQITEGMPTPGGGFQRDTRPSQAPAMWSKSLPDTTSGPLNTGKTGLGVFQSAAGALANVAGPSVKTMSKICDVMPGAAANELGAAFKSNWETQNPDDIDYEGIHDGLKDLAKQDGKSDDDAAQAIQQKFPVLHTIVTGIRAGASPNKTKTGAGALGNDRLGVALGNSNDRFYALSDSNGWRFVN